LTREPTHLWPCRAATACAIAVRPERLAIRASRLQLDQLSLLRDHRLLLSLDPPEAESPSRKGLTRARIPRTPSDDPSSSREVVSGTAGCVPLRTADLSRRRSLVVVHSLAYFIVPANGQVTLSDQDANARSWPNPVARSRVAQSFLTRSTGTSPHQAPQTRALRKRAGQVRRGSEC
jgi:hypothetical protein